MAIQKIKREDINFDKIYGTKYDAQNEQNNVTVQSVYWGDNGDLMVDFDDNTNTGLVTENGVALGYINKDSLKNNETTSSSASMYNGSYRDESNVMQKQTRIASITNNSMYDGSFRHDSDVMTKETQRNNILFQEEAPETFEEEPVYTENLDEEVNNEGGSQVIEPIQNVSEESSEVITPIEQENVPTPEVSTQPEQIAPIEQENVPAEEMPLPQEEITPIEQAPTPSTEAGGQEIAIPASVPQTGIVKNYTNYDYFYGKWNKGSAQRELSEQWAAAGKPNDRGIATLNNRYLVAVSPKFGKVGDNIDVCLDNGVVIPCTIGDAKGADAQSEWGHTFGSAVDVIEWESMGGQDIINTDGWQGHKVSSIINRDRV